MGGETKVVSFNAGADGGLIPAWAGKPLTNPTERPDEQVYPRVGGETMRGAADDAEAGLGVYPRVGGETP